MSSVASQIKLAGAYVEVGLKSTLDKELMDEQQTLRSHAARMKTILGEVGRLEKEHETKKYKGNEPHRELLRQARLAQYAVASDVERSQANIRDIQAKRQEAADRAIRRRQDDELRRDRGLKMQAAQRSDKAQVSDARASLMARLAIYKAEKAKVLEGQKDLQDRMSGYHLKGTDARVRNLRREAVEMAQTAGKNVALRDQVRKYYAFRHNEIVDEEDGGGGGRPKGLLRSAVSYLGRGGKRAANIFGASTPVLAAAVGVKAVTTAAEYSQDMFQKGLYESTGQLDKAAEITLKWASDLKQLPLIGSAFNLVLTETEHKANRIVEIFSAGKQAVDDFMKNRRQERVEHETHFKGSLLRQEAQIPFHRKEEEELKAAAATALQSEIDKRTAAYNEEMRKWNNLDRQYQAKGMTNYDPKPVAPNNADLIQKLTAAKQTIESIRTERKNMYGDIAVQRALNKQGDLTAYRGAVLGRRQGTADTSRSAMQARHDEELSEARIKRTADLTPILASQAGERKKANEADYDLMRKRLAVQQAQEMQEARLARREDIPALVKTQKEASAALEAQITAEKMKQLQVDADLINQERERQEDRRISIDAIKEELSIRRKLAGIRNPAELEWAQRQPGLKRLNATPTEQQAIRDEIFAAHKDERIADIGRAKEAALDKIYASREREPWKKRWAEEEAERKQHGATDAELAGLKETRHVEWLAQDAERRLDNLRGPDRLAKEKRHIREEYDAGMFGVGTEAEKNRDRLLKQAELQNMPRLQTSGLMNQGVWYGFGGGPDLPAINKNTAATVSLLTRIASQGNPLSRFGP